MGKGLIAVLLGFCFSITALAQGVPALSASESVPVLPKTWMGVSGDTSIGAISRKNPLHYLHVGEAGEVKGWNKHDSPATMTILKQEGRHIELQFKNPKYQINEIGVLSADGKKIQVMSKESTGLFTIDGDKISGCGISRGSNGLFGHWLGSYSAWCDEYSTSSASIPPSKQSIINLPKTWTGVISATTVGLINKHQPTDQSSVGKEKKASGWSTYFAPRTLTILRQEGRHVEFLYQSPSFKEKWIGMLSADGKQIQVISQHTSGLWTISGEKMTGCATGRGMNGAFDHWLNEYSASCYEFIAGTSPPPVAHNIPILPKEWKGEVFTTAMGTPYNSNPKHSKHVGKEKEAQGWNSYNSPRSISILRQEGRHVELLLKYPKGETKYIATLSFDGSQLQIMEKHLEVLFAVSANSLSGCGSSRSSEGTFGDWKDKYSVFCYEYTALQ